MPLARLISFCVSFLFVALTPGLCMTLAMSLGISIGARRALWMMLGELTGVALVGTAAVLGAAALVLKAPTAFAVFKWIGAAYLFYMANQTWRAEPMRPEQLTAGAVRTRWSLIAQGFITAVANPKAWAFLLALLPPFIDRTRPVAPQLLTLLVLMLVIEFTSLQIYAHGGRALSEMLHRRGMARSLNHLAALLMAAVGLWLALE